MCRRSARRGRFGTENSLFPWGFKPRRLPFVQEGTEVENRAAITV